jgi:hypothetical protein
MWSAPLGSEWCPATLSRRRSMSKSLDDIGAGPRYALDGGGPCRGWLLCPSPPTSPVHELAPLRGSEPPENGPARSSSERTRW